ncbi:cytoplasmic protein, partial [Salmonella enterica]
MTRSRICPDTESTGLSPASDALPVRETTEQFAQVFFGKSVSLLTPEERFT